MTLTPVPFRIGRYLALRLIGHAILGVLLLALALVAVAPMLGDAGFWPSPWSLAGPALVAAALVTAWRLRRSGESAALDTAAPGPGLFVPLALAGVLWHLPFLVAGDGVTGREPRPPEGRVWSGADGSLVLLGAGFRFSFSADEQLGAEAMASPALPAGFRPLPKNVRRHRRQLFLARGPLQPDDSPLDPSVLRWLYVLWGVVAPSLALGRRSARWGWLLLLPFPALVVLL